VELKSLRVADMQNSTHQWQHNCQVHQFALITDPLHLSHR
jgi:hypothetical protein